MAKRNDLARRIETIDGKVGRLSASADERFNQIDERFDGIEAAIVDQRRYTEFAYERVDTKFVRLEAKMDSGFARLERKMDQILDLHLPKPPSGDQNFTGSRQRGAWPA